MSSSSDKRSRAARSLTWTAGQVSRLVSWIGDIRIDDLLPTEFQPERLELQIAAQVRRGLPDRRDEAARLRARHPGESADQLLDRLFEPFFQAAMRVTASQAAFDVVPLAFLVEDTAKRHTARSLLGKQIDLVVTACLLYHPELGAPAATESVLKVLDEVHDLERIREDLRHRSVFDKLRQEGGRTIAWGAAKLLLRQVTRVLRLGGTMAEAYGRYSRFRELHHAIRARCGDLGGG